MQLWYIGGEEVELHSFLTSALDAGDWLKSRPADLLPRNEHGFPFYRKLDGLHSRFGRLREKKNLWFL
jgi:hypothetical protein